MALAVDVSGGRGDPAGGRGRAETDVNSCYEPTSALICSRHETRFGLREALMWPVYRFANVPPVDQLARLRSSSSSSAFVLSVTSFRASVNGSQQTFFTPSPPGQGRHDAHAGNIWA